MLGLLVGLQSPGASAIGFSLRFSVDGFAMKSELWLTLCLMLAPGFAFAQSCPEGIPSAGNPQCLPPTAENSPYYQGDSSQPSAPPVRWADRWGAIATDAQNARLGAVVDFPNERKAKRASLETCQQNGGTNCSVEIAYVNQCAVLVTGDRLYNSARGPTVEAATQYAMNVCEKGDSNCRVYYSACSLPVRVQ